MSISLGDRVIDIISGFEGKVIGIARYKYRSSQVEVEGKGEPNKGYWIDVERIEKKSSSRKIGYNNKGSK